MELLMSSLTRTLIALVLIGLTAPTVPADSWAPPRPQVFASSYGLYGLKTLPPEALSGQSQARLFTLEKDGKEKVIWETKLVNIPHRALVTDDGKYVVTLDTWANVGFKHSLVIYGEKGKVIADFELEDLLTKDEIAKNVELTETSRWWSKGARVELNPTNDQLTMTLKWGKVIRVSLPKGRVE
jgi:hypothetical protein